MNKIHSYVYGLREMTLGTFYNGEYLLYQRSIFIYRFTTMHYKRLILRLNYRYFILFSKRTKVRTSK
jgi:hypothetical protein